VLTHEMGHALHMSRIYILSTLKISTLISAYLQKWLFTRANKYLIVNKKSLPKWGFYLVYGIYLLFAYQNHFNLYPFLRYEEFMANELSLVFSDGYSLRGYYDYIRTHENKTIRRFDPVHPSIYMQYDRLNQAMKERGNVYDNCDIAKNHKITVHKFTDTMDYNRQIVDFYNHAVDHELTGYYGYIAKAYETLKMMDEAKSYYQKSADNGVKSSMVRLIDLLADEGNAEAAMTYVDQLAELNDPQAKIIQTYYEKDFVLVENKCQESLVENIPYKTLRLCINRTFVIKSDEGTIKGTFTRTNHRCVLTSDDNERTILTLVSGQIKTSAYVRTVEGDKEFICHDIYMLQKKEGEGE
ncbi:MAG TPA: hypothetical protein PK113_06015, partial [Bacillota bacterium]|nr:hypothetical protein [Bacillota bacterium]